VLAVPVNQFDELRREFGQIGQRFMDHYRFGGRGAGGWTTGRAFGGDPFALDEKDGLVVLTVQSGAVAFDKHDGGSLRGELEGCKINMA
jgi:hypothetical protein